MPTTRPPSSMAIGSAIRLDTRSVKAIEGLTGADGGLTGLDRRDLLRREECPVTSPGFRSRGTEKLTNRSVCMIFAPFETESRRGAAHGTAA